MFEVDIVACSQEIKGDIHLTIQALYGLNAMLTLYSTRDKGRQPLDHPGLIWSKCNVIII